MLAGLSLSGCTPRLWGDLALTVDSDDTVVAAVQMCDGFVDFVKAYYYLDSDAHTATVGKWGFTDEVDDFATINLGSRAAIEALPAGRTVYLYANSEDGSHQTDRTELTADLVESLKVGEYLYWNGTVSESDFKTDACSN